MSLDTFTAMPNICDYSKVLQTFKLERLSLEAFTKQSNICVLGQMQLSWNGCYQILLQPSLIIFVIMARCCGQLRQNSCNQVFLQPSLLSEIKARCSGQLSQSVVGARFIDIVLMSLVFTAQSNIGDEGQLPTLMQHRQKVSNDLAYYPRMSAMKEVVMSLREFLTAKSNI